MLLLQVKLSTVVVQHVLLIMIRMEQSVSNVPLLTAKLAHQLLEHNTLVLNVNQDTIRQMTPLVLHAQVIVWLVELVPPIVRLALLDSDLTLLLPPVLPVLLLDVLPVQPVLLHVLYVKMDILLRITIQIQQYVWNAQIIVRPVVKMVRHVPLVKLDSLKEIMSVWLEQLYVIWLSQILNAHYANMKLDL